MNLYIIIIVLVLFILYYIQSDIFKKISFTNTYIIGIPNNNNIKQFIKIFLEILDNDSITLKIYDSHYTLLNDLNESKINFGITYENNLLESQLGLNMYRNNKLSDIQFVTGLFYNYQYFITNILYKDENKIEPLAVVHDIKHFYTIYNRHFIIGTEQSSSESYNGLLVLLYMYGLNPVNINDKDDNITYSDNTIFIANYYIDELMIKFKKNDVDGIYLINIYNYKKIRDIIDDKDVIFLNITYENTIFNDIYSNYYFDKTITISNLSNDIDSTYTFETKMNRIVLISNNTTDNKIVDTIINSYYINNNILINTLLENNKNTLEHFTFEPIDMIYVNKYIKIHEAAYNYMKSLGYIIDNTTKNSLDVNKNENYKHYWKYDKIGGKEFIIE